MTDPLPLTKIAGCTLRQGDKYLLVQEKKPAVYGKWNLPAGHVDPGESVEQAAIREVREETGYLVVLRQKVLFEQAPEVGREFHIFDAQIVSGELHIPADELLAANWFTLDEIYKLQQADSLRSEWMVRALKHAARQ